MCFASLCFIAMHTWYQVGGGGFRRPLILWSAIRHFKLVCCWACVRTAQFRACAISPMMGCRISRPDVLSAICGFSFAVGLMATRRLPSAHRVPVAPLMTHTALSVVSGRNGSVAPHWIRDPSSVWVGRADLHQPEPGGACSKTGAAFVAAGAQRFAWRVSKDPDTNDRVRPSIPRGTILFNATGLIGGWSHLLCALRFWGKTQFIEAVALPARCSRNWGPTDWAIFFWA